MKNKKVLIIAYYYPPMISGGTQRVKNFFYKLRDHGFDTYLITSGFENVDYSDDDRNIIRCPEISKNSYRNKWVIFRTIQKMLIGIGIPVPWEGYWERNAKKSIRKYVKQVKPDICIVSYPPISSVRLGSYVKRVDPDIKLVTDFRDGLSILPVESVYNKRLFKIRYDRDEKRIIEKSDLVVTTIDIMTELMQKKYAHPNVRTIMNGFDEKETVEVEPLKLNRERFNLLYTGTLDYSKKGTFDFCKEAFTEMFRELPDCDFHFIGRYNEQENIFFNRYSNVHVYPPMPRDRILATQEQADAFILVTPEEGYLKGKMYEYIFSKKPIVHLSENECANKIIGETDSGKSFHLDEGDKAAEFIKDLREGKYVFKFQNLEKYTRSSQVKELAKLLNEL